MSNAMTNLAFKTSRPEQPEKLTAAQTENRLIAQWVAALSPWFVHKNGVLPISREKYFAVYVGDLQSEGLGADAYTELSARFIRKRCTFWPCVAEMIALLREYLTPIEDKRREVRAKIENKKTPEWARNLELREQCAAREWISEYESGFASWRKRFPDESDEQLHERAFAFLAQFYPILERAIPFKQKPQRERDFLKAKGYVK